MKKSAMTRFIPAIAVSAAMAGSSFAGGYPYSPARIPDVAVTGGFWLPRIETNRAVTVWSDLTRCEETLAHAAINYS